MSVDESDAIRSAWSIASASREHDELAVSGCCVTGSTCSEGEEEQAEPAEGRYVVRRGRVVAAWLPPDRAL
jgi:hypothetical protein